MVFLHEIGLCRCSEDGIIGLAVRPAIRHGQATPAADDHCLELLAPKYRSEAKSAEVPVCLGDNAGIAHQPFSGSADTHD
jgi:hypothetical protein